MIGRSSLLTLQRFNGLTRRRHVGSDLSWTSYSSRRPPLSAFLPVRVRAEPVRSSDTGWRLSQRVFHVSRGAGVLSYSGAAPMGRHSVFCSGGWSNLLSFEKLPQTSDDLTPCAGPCGLGDRK